MKDIARKCGVSVATVSKALNDQQDIGEETRERIRRAADEMGYLTNASARALKTRRSYNIGVLFVDKRSSGLAHEYFSAVLDSVRVEAKRHGYDITFINSSAGPQTHSYLQHCRYRGVDGVVIASVDFNNPMVQELVNSDIPVVTIDHVFNNHVAVVSNNVGGVEALVRYAASRGHRKIAFIHGEMTAVTENRLSGFYRGCAECGITPEKTFLCQSAYHDSAGCREKTLQLLRRPDRPSCILLPDDFSAIGALNAIRELGLRVPEDVSIMGYDGIPLSQVISPRLTTYRQNTRDLGCIATAKLIELIESPRTVLLDRIVVRGELLEGESVKTLSDHTQG